jgi:peptide/nickel transport system substrate-binding protein
MNAPFIFRPKKRFSLDRFFLYLHRLHPSDALLLKAILLATLVFTIMVLTHMSVSYSKRIASFGGMFTEGIIGTPRFVNPVLAVTRADKDLSALIYDGLLRLGPSGTLIPHVAESVTISEDGLTYNVILRTDTTFHDGAHITVDDVLYTVTQIQNPQINSPLRANFEGVRAEKISDKEMNFILPEPYAPFIENLTFGILPEHIWKGASAEDFPFSEYNSNPIGSGPYRVEQIIRDKSGIPETYILTAFSDYAVAQPKIETLKLFFFPTEEKLIQAFTKGDIEAVAGVDARNITKYTVLPESHNIQQIPLPRTFVLFLNQNKSPALRDPAVRKALTLAIDKSALVEHVVGGYGSALSTPVPPGFTQLNLASTSQGANIEEARAILRNAGWKLHTDTGVWEKTIDGARVPLSFSIATAHSGVFEATAQFIEDAWSAIGIQVSIKQFEQSDLTQGVIRPRDYEILLFGTQLGRSLDFYSFWHSSQRNDPGLNIALYANITTDSILNEMRRSHTETNRTEALGKFTDELLKENPAIFLFAPKLIYIVPRRVTTTLYPSIEEAHERFASIVDWYIETEPIWPTFIK